MFKITVSVNTAYEQDNFSVGFRRYRDAVAYVRRLADEYFSAMAEDTDDVHRISNDDDGVTIFTAGTVNGRTAITGTVAICIN